MKKLVILLLLFLTFSCKSADYKRMIPFVMQQEGGFVRFKTEEQETNKGITWATWKVYYGNTHSKFLKMSDSDWEYVWKRGYWDIVWGDKIDDQNLAEVLADWAWMSGSRVPVMKLQKIVFVKQTGVMNQETIDAINYSAKLFLYREFSKERFKYYVSLPLYSSRYKPYINGWLNRLWDLAIWQFSQLDCKY